MTNTIVPVILCGGSGTRLWPLSREQYPKQLLSLINENTLLQATVERLYQQSSEFELKLDSPVIVTNENHRFLVAEQLREIDRADAKILLEPCGKNTAPALCIAANYIAEQDPNAIMLVMPADHVIQNETAFLRAIVEGLLQLDDKHLGTFGIVPNAPETGFGYIKLGKKVTENISTISQFIEKPDLQAAEQFVASGEYLWNSGMFLFSAQAWLDAIKHFRHDIYQACNAAYREKTVDMDFIRVDKAQFEACPSESIDYAVMEHVADVVGDESGFSGTVVSLDAGWSDIGSWESLWSISEKDASGNVLKGDVYIEDTNDSMIFTDGRVVSVIGLSEIIVIDTPDAVLVADKKASQTVKNIVGQLANDKRSEIITHRRVFRPWGSYESIDNGDRFQVKRIVVNCGARLSLQMHHHRAEHWIVVKGTAKVTRGEDVFLLSENESTYIPLGVKHRLENPGTIPLEIIEVQSGTYLGEDDIVRYQDEYGRKE